MTTTIICGDPGTGKSLLLDQIHTSGQDSMLANVWDFREDPEQLTRELYRTDAKVILLDEADWLAANSQTNYEWAGVVRWIRKGSFGKDIYLAGQRMELLRRIAPVDKYLLCSRDGGSFVIKEAIRRDGMIVTKPDGTQEHHPHEMFVKERQRVKWRDMVERIKSMFMEQ